jgi:hypothetical protein
MLALGRVGDHAQSEAEHAEGGQFALMAPTTVSIF